MFILRDKYDLAKNPTISIRSSFLSCLELSKRIPNHYWLLPVFALER